MVIGIHALHKINPTDVGDPLTLAQVELQHWRLWFEGNIAQIFMDSSRSCICADTSGWNDFPPWGGWAQPWKEDEELSRGSTE